MRHKSNPFAQQGFSVIELMVAMTLSVILLGGTLSVLYSS
jgi:prepilin-type N-terminal cleavage/methylation domain-containing protein